MSEKYHHCRKKNINKLLLFTGCCVEHMISVSMRREYRDSFSITRKEIFLLDLFVLKNIGTSLCSEVARLKIFKKYKFADIWRVISLMEKNYFWNEDQ